PGVPDAGPANRKRLHQRSGGAVAGSACASDDGGGPRVLRLRNGAASIVQRRGRHLDADVPQPVVLLVAADSAGMGPVAASRGLGRLSGHPTGRVHADCAERNGVLPGQVETPAGVRLASRCRPHIAFGARPPIHIRVGVTLTVREFMATTVEATTTKQRVREPVTASSWLQDPKRQAAAGAIAAAVIALGIWVVITSGRRKEEFASRV